MTEEGIKAFSGHLSLFLPPISAITLATKPLQLASEFFLRCEQKILCGELSDFGGILYVFGGERGCQ